MRGGLRFRPLKLVALVTLIAAAAAALAMPTPAQAAEPLLVRNAISEFDRFLVDPSEARQRWIGRHYFQMRGYSPFFERNAMPWGPPPTSFAQNLYAIYNPAERDLVEAHPDWLLRDLLGRPLYIPHECAEGSCPQYAADVGNPRWRRHWIKRARRIFGAGERRDRDGRGYVGVYIDDVNLELRASDGFGVDLLPFDPRTLQPMTEQAWQLYFVEFLEQIREAFPRAQITHNPLWWMDHSDPEVRRQVAAADWIELERGFNDAGITPGDGRFGYETLLAHIDWLHRRQKRVILQPYLETEEQARYELANYFLVRRGRDAINSKYRSDPPSGGVSSLWRGWNVNPGPPERRRELLESGLWRRRFERGTALVSPPGGPAATVTFQRPHTNLAGERGRRFELTPQSGDVYVR